MAPNDHTSVTATQPQRQAHTDTTYVQIDRFNGISGISIGDYIRNIEASVQSQGFTGERFEQECVYLARNRLDLTKSVDLSEVAKSIDLQPQEDKSWVWVKNSFTQSFGHDTSCPSYAFNTLFSLKPRDLSVKGIATCISSINARLQEWQRTGQPTQMVALINQGDSANKQYIKKFFTVSILASIFPVDQRPRVCRKLEATDMNQMANMVHELLDLHNANSATTMAAQATPTTPKTQPPQQSQHSSPLHNSVANRGRGTYRGSNRGRGFGYQQTQRYSQGYANQQQQQYNNRPQNPQMAKYWPTFDQCIRCVRPGHRAAQCTNTPYCPFHKHEGHYISVCKGFQNYLSQLGGRVRNRPNLPRSRIPLTHGPAIIDPRYNTVLTDIGLHCFISHLGTHSGSKPLLPGLLNGRPAKLFLDTGSTISIIDARTIREYGLSTKMHPSPLQIHGISGSVKVLGFIECKLLWEDQYFVQSLLVLDCLTAPGTLLLGWDFLVKVGCIIDAKSNSVNFGTHTYPLTTEAIHDSDIRGPKIWTADQFYKGMLHIPSPRASSFYNDSTRSQEINHKTLESPTKIVNQESESQSKPNATYEEIPETISNDEMKLTNLTTYLPDDSEQIDLVEGEKLVTRVTASKDILLKPFSRVLADVDVHVKCKTNIVKQGLFVINPLLAELEGITVITGLYSFENGKAKIFIVNLTKGLISVRKGDRLAGIEFLNCELEVQDTPECFTVDGGSQEDKETVTKALHDTLGAFPVHFTQGKSAIKKLFTAFPGVLPSKSRPIGKTSILQHEIKLKEGVNPIRLPAYRIPHSRRKALDEEIKGMLMAGIITPSSSEWSSPLLLVPKSDGSFRPVVDFRSLNQLTVDECFPVPALEEVLRNIRSNTRIFSSIDLAKGYFQIPLHPNSRHITAFSSSAGHFEFARLPMGLKSAPLTFARLMTCVFQDLMDDSILSYLDDILICSDSIENHCDKLKHVFERLEKAGLTIRPNKCRFFQENLIFLGHEISSKGIAPNNLKVKAVENFPMPKTKKELRAFLGLSGFFRKFLKNYSTIAAPLTDLLKDDFAWEWGDAQMKAFETLKALLVNAPVLAYPDYEKPFKLYCDASAIGVGATLCQEVNSMIHPIAYASRKLDETQKKWHITDREMYAIAWGLKHFRSLIMGYEVQVFTDHKPLKNDLKTNTRDPTGRRARFLVTLQDFKAEINYLPGPKNAAPDALSRIGNGEDGINLDVQTADPKSMPPSFRTPIQKSEAEELLIQSFVLFPLEGEPADPITTEDIMKGLQASDVYRPLIKALESNTEPKPIPFLDTRELKLKDGLIVRTLIPKNIKGRVFKPKQQILLPDSLVPTVLRWAHEGFGHLGFMKMANLIRSKYYFPKIAKHVRKHIQACQTCPLSKGKVHVEPSGTYPPPKNPFETMSCDILTLPKSDNGSQYVVVFIDHFSRYCEMRVIPDKTADSVAYAFMNAVIARWGCPIHLISDNGPEFINNIMIKLCARLNIKRPKILPLRPQANGYVERANKSILNILRTLSDERRSNWCEYLELVQGTINGTVHSAIMNSPDYIITGRDKITPVEAIGGKLQPLYTGDTAERCLRMLRETRHHVYQHLVNKAEQDKRLREQARSNRKFKEGQLIFHLKDKTGQIRPKLHQSFEGPWRLTNVKRNRLTARCLETGRIYEIHPDTAKPAYAEYEQALERRM